MGALGEPLDVGDAVTPAVVVAQALVDVLHADAHALFAFVGAELFVEQGVDFFVRDAVAVVDDVDQQIVAVGFGFDGDRRRL